MPLWTKHVETGLLMHERGTLVLLRDDGGRWRLDMVAGVEELLGGRVRVEGVRSAFDRLDVRSIERA